MEEVTLNMDLMGAIFGIQSQEDWDDDLSNTHRAQAQQQAEAQNAQVEDKTTEKGTAMPICQYTGITFAGVPWVRVHPAIRAARNAMQDRHAGGYQHLYMSAADRVLESAAPFALADVDRLISEAERIAAEQEQEHRKTDLSDEESEALNRKYEAVYGDGGRYPTEWELRGTDESGE
jgi:hypothetical protein